MISRTPEPPYYAVIFTSTRTEGDHGYASMSYWRDLESIKNWKHHAEHSIAIVERDYEIDKS
jgi:heme-degrading monooxygenase HmoA